MAKTAPPQIVTQNQYTFRQDAGNGVAHNLQSAKGVETRIACQLELKRSGGRDIVLAWLEVVHRRRSMLRQCPSVAGTFVCPLNLSTKIFLIGSKKKARRRMIHLGLESLTLIPSRGVAGSVDNTLGCLGCSIYFHCCCCCVCALCCVGRGGWNISFLMVDDVIYHIFEGT